MPNREPKPSDSIPPLVAWFSRNSGWLILLTILAVVLLEGVGIYHIDRRANSAASSPTHNAASQAPATAAP